jgi:hypothetical protein
LVSNELEGISMEAVVAWSKYCAGIYLENMKKPQKHFRIAFDLPDIRDEYLLNASESYTATLIC